MNQQKVTNSFPNIVEISQDGEVIYRQRLWGSFSQPLKLKDFPFDRQVFNIQLAAIGYSPDEVKLVSIKNRPFVAENLSIPDWDITNWTTHEAAFEPMPGVKIAGFKLTFEGKRNKGFFILKGIIPLILIIAMSWVVFWIDPREAGSQISVAITTMLTLIAYRFAIGTSVPKISELTKLDSFIFCATFLVFASLIEVTITSNYAKRGKVERAKLIDKWSRWIFPIVFILIALESLVFRFII